MRARAAQVTCPRQLLRGVRRASVLLWWSLVACGGQSLVPSPSGGAPSTSAGVTSSGAGQGGGLSSAGKSAGGALGGNGPSRAGASTGGASGAGEGGEVGAGGCSENDVQGLEVYSNGTWDPLGYPPYAIDGCRVLYVATDGALHLRTLGTDADELLEPQSAKPRRPTLAGDVLAWEIEDEAGKSQVRVLYDGTKRTLSHELDHAAEPRATREAVVFTAFLGPSDTDDSDVYLYRAASNELVPVAVGPGQQRFPDVSETHVALTDFSEDPAGHFDALGSISDVVVVDRSTGQSLPRHATGKQAFPLLGSDGALLYLDWGEVHPEPKFSKFWLKTGHITQPSELDVSLTTEQVQTNPAYVRPALHGLNVDYIDTRAGEVGLYRATLGSVPPSRVGALGSAPQLLGPVATHSLTLLASRQGTTLTLVAVRR